MGGEVRWLPRRLGGTAELAMYCVLGGVGETQGLDVLGKGRPVMRSLSMVGVVRVEAGRSSPWCRVVPQPSVLLLRPEQRFYGEIVFLRKDYLFGFSLGWMGDTLLSRTS